MGAGFLNCVYSCTSLPFGIFQNSRTATTQNDHRHVFFSFFSSSPHRLDKRRQRVVLTVRVFSAAQLFTVHHSAISHYTTLWFVIISVLKSQREGLLPLCQPPSRHKIRKQPVGEDMGFLLLPVLAKEPIGQMSGLIRTK